MKLSQPRMPGRNGKGMWKMPTRRAFTPQGITPGANVTVLSLMGRQAGFQVWAKGPTPRHWWVTNGRECVEVHEFDLMLVGQCTEDGALFEQAS